jgi:hypothetical protein
MKARRFFAFAILALSTAVLFVGCSFLNTGTSIDSRISQFMTAISEDPASAYTHFSSTAAITAYAKTTSFWETHFPAADGPYTASITSKTDTADVRVTITGGTSGLSNNYSFSMTNTGTYSEDWYIADIAIYSNGAFVSLFGTT